ncbi:hypothetical protein CCACVL1_26693 [Corchorus capsularis]|uniref:Uncharacterized protein n=1 Tax=Corchorus capsularis TaxID=210143 RepID=A0A1R3GDR9_COCAP|nr:hypothetical protein CCACVL1_26693 [Corchorus capsularis]
MNTFEYQEHKPRTQPPATAIHRSRKTPKATKTLHSPYPTQIWP